MRLSTLIDVDAIPPHSMRVPRRNPVRFEGLAPIDIADVEGEGIGHLSTLWMPQLFVLWVITVRKFVGFSLVLDS